MKGNSKKNFNANKYYPTSIGQAVQHLLYHLPFRDKLEVSIKTEHELPALHTSLGNYIQQEFRLDGNMRLIESCLSHSDNEAIDSEDASKIIIKEFWKQLKGTQKSAPLK